MSITEGAFRNQGSLKHLKLDGNKIGEVTNKTFFKLPQMEVISLRSNEIAELPQNFRGMRGGPVRLEVWPVGRRRLPAEVP